MNTQRITTLIAVATVAAVPATASAGNEQMALDRCAKALVASIATKTAKPVKLVASRDTDGGTLYADHYEFIVVARRASDYAPVARATCRTDDRGQMLELEAETLKVTDF
jgi:hypothetical protein